MVIFFSQARILVWIETVASNRFGIRFSGSQRSQWSVQKFNSIWDIGRQIDRAKRKSKSWTKVTVRRSMIRVGRVEGRSFDDVYTKNVNLCMVCTLCGSEKARAGRGGRKIFNSRSNLAPKRQQVSSLSNASKFKASSRSHVSTVWWCLQRSTTMY